MSASDDSDLNKTYAAFVGGDERAGNALFAKAKKPVLAAIRARAADLRHDHEDILNEVFVLLLEAPARFQPARGSILSFFRTVLVPEGIRRVRAKSARAGVKTRREAAKPVTKPSFPIPDPPPAPETVAVTGYGSQEAVEAACDAHMIWARATPPMRLIIGGLLCGKTQTEIGAEAKMDRFTVRRMISGLQRQVSAVA